MEMAKLFQNGKSQAVRLPKKFRFRGNKVIIKKMGEGVILLPYEEPGTSLTEILNLFSNDFMETRDQPKQQIRKGLSK